jgi:altronate hydrolase
LDVDAGRNLRGEADHWVIRSASGQQTASEGLGHAEFIPIWTTFEPIGSSCLPV